MASQLLDMSLNSLDVDVVDLASAFISYPSVTPREEGCLTDLERLLRQEGFVCHLVTFEDTTNLYARLGEGGPHLCFAGHIDVVPPGPENEWTFPPFSPTRHEGKLYGRGIADMKGAIACFLSAFQTFKKEVFQGTCSLLLTSDEEGVGVNGIPRMIPWMRERQEIPDVILIGEPTGQTTGEVLQVGRRGSITGHLRVTGKQGHIAYPHLADNPIPRLIKALQDLIDLPLDQGTKDFQPSHLEVTSIDTGNPTVNILPGSVEARFGLRFNKEHKADQLIERLTHTCQKHGLAQGLQLRLSGNPFLTDHKAWIQCVEEAVAAVKGRSPVHTTQGGTTDGRFLCEVAPVLEVGLPETTIHQIDEHVEIEDLYTLKAIYAGILQRYFKQETTA